MTTLSTRFCRPTRFGARSVLVAVMACALAACSSGPGAPSGEADLYGAWCSAVEPTDGAPPLALTFEPVAGRSVMHVFHVDPAPSGAAVDGTNAASVREVQTSRYEIAYEDGLSAIVATVTASTTTAHIGRRFRTWIYDYSSDQMIIESTQAPSGERVMSRCAGPEALLGGSAPVP